MSVMFTVGLVSITFRSLSAEEIVRLALKAGLNRIEWGGDIHVPHGDIPRARAVSRLTHEAGLKIAAYGSYYRLGQGEPQGVAFERVLESARALGAPTIRVWAGVKGSRDTSAEERRKISRDALRVADMAEKAGVTISLEYHGGTLTDRRESVADLMRELPHSHIKFLWQPSEGESLEACTERLEDVLPRLSHVHVFHWWPTNGDRRSLAEGETRWKHYVDTVRRANKPTAFLLEYVADDSPRQLCEDAIVLRRLLE